MPADSIPQSDFLVARSPPQRAPHSSSLGGEMKLHRLIASMAALLIGAFRAHMAHADTLNPFSVRLFLVNTDMPTTELTTNPPLQLTSSAVNLDADSPPVRARRDFFNG